MTTTTGRCPLTESERSAIARLLCEQRRFRVEQIAQLLATVPATAPSRTDVRDEIRRTLLRGARLALLEIDGAIARLGDGSYGWCTRCGCLLSADQLDVLPYTASCPPCRRAVDP